jgi:predicted nucleic acid-binding protein
MTALVFVDTNVLLYRFDSSLPDKQIAAQTWIELLWHSRRGRLSTQVLQEFYVNATRKLNPGLDRRTAQDEVRALFLWRPIPIENEVFEGAWRIQERFGLSFWDALIVSASRIGGCRYLLTEDLQHGQDLDGVQVVNPFMEAPASLPVS